MKRTLAGYLRIFACCAGVLLAVILWGSRVLPTAGSVERVQLVIDPGHGGEDGGAVSCTGAPESQINLEISLRLRDLFRLLGYNPTLLRQEDVSIYTTGKTLSEKKVSDLKERVRLVNATENGLLLSIHQNYFPQSQYSGAQVFCNAAGKELAGALQASLIGTLDPNSHRSVKSGKGIYLLEKANCPAVLIECGFLSNEAEEAKLRSPDYQKKLCCCIAATVTEFLTRRESTDIM